MRRHSALSTMTEFELIHRFFSGLDFGPSTRLGIGDDAAILDIPPAHSLVVSVDSSNENTHFTELTLPEVVAYRSIASAISDLAAMGGHTYRNDPCSLFVRAGSAVVAQF